MLCEMLTAPSSQTVIPVMVAAANWQCPVPVGFMNPGKGSSEGRTYLQREAYVCVSLERGSSLSPCLGWDVRLRAGPHLTHA